MNKYEKRINKLFRETHFYISPDELQTVMNYQKAVLDANNVSPDDYQAEREQIDIIGKEYGKNPNEELFNKVLEIIQKSDLVFHAITYPFAKKFYDSHPNGVWLSAKTWKEYLFTLQAAKDYFRARKNKI